MEKRPFFRSAMVGLGKYRMGGYGRIGSIGLRNTYSDEGSQ